MLLTIFNPTGSGKMRQRNVGHFFAVSEPIYCGGGGKYCSFVANFPLSQYTERNGSNPKETACMLLNRDYVGHMASDVVKKLIEGNLVEIKEKDLEPVIARVRMRMMEEITVEDKVNEEARTILTQHQDEMRRAGISYQDMFKKVKGQIARDRKLILR
jgi:hypothetical protein